MSALDYQVGGDHYKNFEIQPAEFITRNGIGFLPGCIIKRACRFNQPSGKGIQDLKKTKQEVDLLIEMLYEEETECDDGCNSGNVSGKARSDTENVFNEIEASDADWRNFWQDVSGDDFLLIKNNLT